MINITLIIGYFSPLQAAALGNDTSQDSKTELTEELAIEIAEGFTNGIESTSDIETANPVKFYNPDGQAIGYIVGFSKNNGIVSAYSTKDDDNKVYRVDPFTYMMSVQGYSLLQLKGTSTRIETIRGSDGWGANPRYINLTQIEWIMVIGYGFHT